MLGPPRSTEAAGHQPPWKRRRLDTNRLLFQVSPVSPTSYPSQPVGWRPPCWGAYVPVTSPAFPPLPHCLHGTSTVLAEHLSSPPPPPVATGGGRWRQVAGRVHHAPPPLGRPSFGKQTERGGAAVHRAPPASAQAANIRTREDCAYAPAQSLHSQPAPLPPPSYGTSRLVAGGALNEGTHALTYPTAYRSSSR